MAVVTAAEVGNDNVVRFLDLIAWAEGTSTSPATQCDGYDVIVTGHDGHLNIFTDFSRHPFDDGRPPIIVRVDEEGKPILDSTASGRYQVKQHIWEAYKGPLHLADFGPRSQDFIALRLLKDCGALIHVIGGEIGVAITAAHNEWASFPGNSYGQGGKSMDALLAKFQQLNGAA